MTENEANAIDLKNERDLELLRNCAIFWQEKALNLQIELNRKGQNITTEQIEREFPIDNIRDIINK